jgi:hypothetical protein
MSQWFRIFGTTDAQPEPAALLEHLQSLGIETTGQFRGDHQGWFQADLNCGADVAPLHVERFLAQEEGIRDILNTWAGWIETAEESPSRGRLMQHVIATSQLFVMERPADHTDETLCVGVSRFLARQTAGVYQVDDQGFFSPDGMLLLQEFR